MEPMRIVDIAANANVTYTAQFAACTQSSGINNPLAESGITLYPNPAKDEIFIQSEQPAEKVEVFNSDGRIVLSTNATTIHVSHLPKGIYIVRILVGNQSITQKVIKE